MNQLDLEAKKKLRALSAGKRVSHAIDFGFTSDWFTK